MCHDGIKGMNLIGLYCIGLYCIGSRYDVCRLRYKRIVLVWFGLDRIGLYCCGGDENKLIVPRFWLRLRYGCCVVMVVVVPEFMTV